MKDLFSVLSLMLFSLLIPAISIAQIVDIESSTEGLAPPRVADASALTCSASEIGSIVYQTDAPKGLYTCDGTGWSLVGGGNSPSVIGTSIFPSGATYYAGPWTNNNNSDEAEARFPMPAGTLSELRVYSPGTSDQSMTVTVMRNGSDTGVSCTIGAGANSCEDLTNSQAFIAGEGLTFKLERPGSSPGKYLRVTTKWQGQ